MADDLLERLREDFAMGDHICGEAADEIERLRAALEKIAWISGPFSRQAVIANDALVYPATEEENDD